MALNERFPPNPHYGAGIYRRRIRMAQGDGLVRADLLDDFHDMACLLRHDGSRVLGIDARIRRAPFTTCPAATLAIGELAGLPLDTPRAALYGDGRPQRNCTHIFDLAAFAMRHAIDRAPMRTIEFVVPDLVEAGSAVEVRVDDAGLLRWTIGADETILAPPDHAGRRLFGGFARWAEERFDGLELDCAIHLQKVVLVARGRRYLIERESENSLRDEPEREGACFTFSEPQFSVARPNRGYVRDFTGGLP